MLNFIGIALIICGFIAPYLRGVQIAQLFFWPGFLILLRPANPLFKTFTWPKWARIGVLLNIGVAAFFFILLGLEYNSLFDKWFIVMNPVGPVINFLFPIDMPVEKIVFGSFRSTILIFLNLLIYIGLAIILGRITAMKSKTIPRRNA
jgi:hypothetical protein